ncbi:MAG: hypothetical protein K2Q22_07335 [Cytophagales bacterium]|nr:hypothetical protein [Cytophagales bacterium]
MKTIMKLFIGGLCALAVLSACNRNVDKELFAPKTISVSPTYSIPGTGFFGTTTAEPVFIQDTTGVGDSIVFKANFGQDVDWTIKIVGQSSGAIKIFNGISSFLDSTNNKWKGTTDNQILFRTGEKVIAELTIRGANVRYYDTLKIGKALDYIAYQKGILIANFNFDLGGSFGGAYPPFGSSFAPYPYIKIGQTNDFPALEGNGTVMFDGEDLDNNSFIGGYYIQNANINGTTPSVYPVKPGITPENLWVNLFVYGVPGSSSQIDIVAKEYDVQPGVNGTLTLGDQYRARFVLNWTGWKLVSFKYSDFVLTPDSKGGNSLKEPQKIRQFTINAGPNPNLPGKKVQFYVDYYTLTYNNVFKF